MNLSRYRVGDYFEGRSIEEYSWKNIVVSLAIITQIAFGILKFRKNPIWIGPDALLFQYSGFVIYRGGVPYRDVWDVKPPLIHEISAVIAHSVNGNPFALAVVSTVLTSGFFVLTVYLIYKLVVEWTGNDLAAATAALVPFVLPEFYYFASRGLRPKLLVIVLGISSLYLYQKERFVFSGILAAASAGLWQFGAFFSVAILGHAFYKLRYRAFVVNILSMIVTTLVVVLPFLLSGTWQQMIEQVVIAPLSTSENGAIFNRILRGGYMLKLSAPLVAIGGVSALLSNWSEYSPWWVAPGMVWYSVQIFIFDLDGTPDLFLGLVFVAFGIGILSHHLNEKWQKYFFLGVVATVVLMFIFYLFIGFLPLYQGLEATQLYQNYWARTLPESCHIRLSGLEQQYMAQEPNSCRPK
ncbi:DolP-mannose mannosyltransferase [Haloferax prahovense]|uniref:DolP-mannose mannosyltransferase n=1 Tax=Haloferax prahovense TaxID=381852 RepID=UPI003C71CEE5